MTTKNPYKFLWWSILLNSVLGVFLTSVLDFSILFTVIIGLTIIVGAYLTDRAIWKGEPGRSTTRPGP